MSIHSFSHNQPSLLSAFAWMTMMGVMMAPTAAPWIAAFHRFDLTGNSRHARLHQTVLFAAGYFAIWLLFGLIAAMVQTLVAIPQSWGGAILIGAGLFQFTSLKRACLTHCRNPVSFLLTRWRDGPPSAIRLGLSHGAYCVGCCWALMMTSLAVGSMNLWWMALLMVTTFAEQATSWGARLRVPVGLSLIVVGLWLWR